MGGHWQGGSTGPRLNETESNNVDNLWQVWLYMCEMARTRARYNHDDDVVVVDDEGKSINKQNQFKRDLSELSFHIPARPRGPVVTVPQLSELSDIERRSKKWYSRYVKTRTRHKRTLTWSG